MDGHRGGRKKGQHGKAAQRIYDEAAQIKARLIKGETVKEVAADYPQITHASFYRHAQIAIGPTRWRKLIYGRGPKKGTPRHKPPEEKPEQRMDPLGPKCFICGQCYAPRALKCDNCGNMFYG